MKKFEYKTLPFKRKSGFWEGFNIDVQELENILVLMDNDGWELVNSIEKSNHLANLDICLIFKREIISA
jgi:Domain of unknown function (DUF4177)